MARPQSRPRFNLHEDSMITLDQVSKTYLTDRIETLALKDINLHIRQGEFVSIMGPSGCGKSTLLNVIGLLDRPASGTVSVHGDPVHTLGDRELARLRNRCFGFVFQSFHLLEDLRVLDNVELPLLYRSMGAGERRRLALAALERVGLGARTSHYPSQLSGGQQQRVAIARAIVGQPEVLLADEPTGNLDSRMGTEIMDLLQQLNNDGTTIVMVTHDDHEARRAHRIVRVFDGQLLPQQEAA
jgi:putative ABC transport system ATP-binding protein